MIMMMVMLVAHNQNKFSIKGGRGRSFVQVIEIIMYVKLNIMLRRHIN